MIILGDKKQNEVEPFVRKWLEFPKAHVQSTIPRKRPEPKGHPGDNRGLRGVLLEFCATTAAIADTRVCPIDSVVGSVSHLSC